MAKKKKCKGTKQSYEPTVKFPVRKICVRCGRHIRRDMYDTPKYQIGEKEFCSNKCYSNYVNSNPQLITGEVKKYAKSKV